MKLIDLLNKIANDEESDLITEFEFDGKIWNFYKFNHSEYCLDNWLLNQNITITRSKSARKEKKIPEKLKIEDDGNTITLYGEKENEWTILDNVDIIICNKINSIVDYLKSKGE